MPASSPAPAEADPFASIPSADPATCEARPRTWGVTERPCELVSKDAPRSKYEPEPDATPKRKKKRVDLNPMQKRWLEREGYTFERVERPNAFGAVTVDMFGFADYLAFKPGEFLLVQTTTVDHASDRIKKIKRSPEASAWLAAGGRIEVHAWKQPGGAGSRWEMVRREVTAGG